MMPLHRYVNQKPDDDNDPYSESGFTLYTCILDNFEHCT